MSSNRGPESEELRRCAAPVLSPAQMRSQNAKLSRLAPDEVVDRVAGSIHFKVHAHIITNGSEGNLTDDQVKDQVALLNYGYGWRPAEGDVFTPPSGPSGINSAYRFDLVSIDRTDNAKWYVVTPEDADAATELEMKTALHRGGRRDLNLYFNAPAGGYLGWATFPWDLDAEPRATNLMKDGVVVHNASIRGGQAPYDQGDSAVHEVGHWIGLFHTFTGGCTGTEEGWTGGDLIKDTGREAGPTWECPGPGVTLDTCKKGDAPGLGNQPDPYTNNMDYSPDACMGTFTKQQMLRANRNVKAYRNDDAPAPTCGNGVLDADEKCDTGILSGAGKCPTVADCDDHQVCTKDEVIGSECQQQCFNDPITEPDDGTDNCCPSATGEAEDPDCTPAPTCGNGHLDPGETCDTAIASGAGHCPTAGECADTDACTTDGVDNAGTCTAACSHQEKGPANGDMCCPDGSNHNDDTDCAAVCGNGVVEPPGEACEPPNTTTCDAHCQEIEPPKPAKAFRVNSMYLRDPHVWFSLFGCKDVTDVPISGDLAVNIQINAQLTKDADGDGNFDMSPVVNLNPYDTSDSAATEATLIVDAKCKVDDSGCTAGEQKYDSNAMSHTSGKCLGKLASTTHGYSPDVTESNAPCLATDERDIAISIQGSNINLKRAKVAATYGGMSLASGGTLTSGLIRGFLTEADADATTLHVSGFDIVLSSVLAGGKDCCQSGFSDKDTLDGTPGWWFYLNYTATETVLN